MATSGTYAFLMNRDGIIGAVLRRLEVIGAGDTIPPGDITNCAEALNVLVKGMVVEGLPLWCVEEIAIPMIAAQATYTIGPGSATPTRRPLRILDAFLRFSTGNDVDLQVVSRYDYNDLGLKTAQGTPNQLYYDPQLTNGVVTVYNAPFDNTTTLHIVIQRQIQDFNLSTDNPDFPQEAYQMLIWSLADELSLEYGAKPHVIAMCASKAKTYRDAFMQFEQEQTSCYFYPSGRKS